MHAGIGTLGSNTGKLMPLEGSGGAAREDRTLDLSLTKGETAILWQDPPVSGSRVLKRNQPLRRLRQFDPVSCGKRE